MAKTKQALSYNEAIAEVEAILKKLGSDELDVDQLGSEVKRATDLIKQCKEKLRKAETEVAEVLTITNQI